ncbi:PREDICTED: uncharacterized protein LOC104816648 [Tarenaya hassleriana]|uniref:uncharacterized protein LOC104816648 n=1 Tax=Tarenaya hassleriana TaxID=28532 RepID=UPI00053C614E|nr:PREDICTED: uncharacterized protein LOC104816648 [Tarenaya hassleriana]
MSGVNVTGQSTARSLDALLQDYAFRVLVRPQTGIPYDGTVPTNLTGIKIAAIRLRNGSFRRRGVAAFKEFSIPSGVIVKPYVQRLALVYHNLANFSQFYYPLSGYDYVAPVLGLLAYDATNLTATNLKELDMRASGDPIRIEFSKLRRIPQGSSARCVRFDLEGLVIFSNMVGNTCETLQQGHFSIVVKSGDKSSPNSWIVIGSVGGALLLLGLLTLFLVWWIRRHRLEMRIREMERAGETGDVLRITLVGDTKAPTAPTTRTQPILQTE